MEVGVLRERIVVSLLIYKFGEENVEIELPITEPEVDVKLFGKPLSIKTITGKKPQGVKLIWTVDAQKAREFQSHYSPSCDILLVQIAWSDSGGLYWIPLSAQLQVYGKLGIEGYIKLPKPGTNPRGVEMTKKALGLLLENPNTQSIPINWQRQEIIYNPYKRWIDLWRED